MKKGLITFALLSTMVSADSGPLRWPGPVAASPGALGGVAGVKGSCPAFSWGDLADARAYEIAVYLTPNDGGAGLSDEAALREVVTGGATSWTPPTHRCLARGEKYAWHVRALQAQGPTEWSQPRFFEVSPSPSLEEVEQALATLRAFQDAEGSRSEGETASERAEPLEPPLGARLKTAGVEDLYEGPPALYSTTVGSRAFSGVYGEVAMHVDIAGATPLTGMRIDLEVTDNYVAGGYGLIVNTTEGLGAYGIIVNAERGGVTAYGNPAIEGRSRLGATKAAGYFRGNQTAQAINARSNVCCTDTEERDYAARIIGDFAIGGDALALRVGQGAPAVTNNFIGFFSAGTLVAEIEGDGAGGVVCDGCSVQAAPSDFAEYLPKLNREDRLEPGDVVGVTAGRLSHDTSHAERVMVVTTRPIILANEPPEDDTDRHAAVAFLGQVPAKVRGRARAGDIVLASGLSDGTAIAIAPGRLSPEKLPLVLGRALEDAATDDTDKVEIMVGAPDLELFSRFVGSKDEQIDDLAARLAVLEKELAARD